MTGKLVDDQGAPIAQAHILSNQSAMGIVTDEAGEFTIRALGDSVGFMISALGFERLKLRRATADAPWVIELHPQPINLPAAEVVEDLVDWTRPSVRPAERLEIEELDQIPSVSRIEALASLPGVDMVSAGFGSLRPMIRGLSGLRIATLFNGARVESQAWGEYHGIYIPEEGVQAVEIIRGPGSLAYGSDAYGGVINFVPNGPLIEKGRESRLSVNGYSATGGWQATAATEKRSRTTFHSFRGGYKQHGTYQLPNGSRVKSSEYRQFFAQGTFGYIRHWGIIEGAYSSAYSNAGLIGHDGRQQSGDHLIAMSLRTHVGLWDLTPRISYQLNHRKEFEEPSSDDLDDLLALDISLRSLRWDLTANRNFAGGWSVVTGVQGFVMSSGFDEEEGVELEPLIPNASAEEVSIFAVATHEHGRLRTQFAARSDARLTHTSRPVEGWDDQERLDLLKAVSLSGSWAFSERLRWTLQASHSERAPGMSELLSMGIHHCAFRFEQGDPAMPKEKSNNIESNWTWAGNHVQWECSVYNHVIQDYVSIVPSGTQEAGYELYRWQSNDATFRGGELAVVLDSKRMEHLMARASLSTVQAEDAEGKALPLIPPSTARVSFGWKDGFWKALSGLNAQAVVQHNRDATLLHFGAGAMVSEDWKISVFVNNALNVEYIPTLSMLRNLGISEPGRNVRLQLTWLF